MEALISNKRKAKSKKINILLITVRFLTKAMDQVSQIREKLDIVSFISEYLSLKKAGKNFQGLCPFHGEKTPSFVVSPERQIWHCFGCGKGGDIYTFLMEYERLEFPEALRYLAKQAGVELVQTNYADSTSSAKKERLYKANALASEFYHYILTKHTAGKKAFEYLKMRGINEKLVKTFKLGFAPGSGRALVRYLLQKKRFPKEDLIDAGLVASYSNGFSDFFKNRLIFPLIDYRDNVVGFSGRLLNESTGFGGKYINTRDTMIYHKRTHFFGLNITKDAIRKTNQAILVEGEFDVMSCFREGITNVLAIKGTALTKEQVNLLSRYAGKITICFDGDSAGQEAIKRSLPVLSQKQINTTVVVIPSGKDPDEALKISPIEFKKAVEHDVSIYDYLFERALGDNQVSTSEGKRKIADSLLYVIDDIENAIVKEHYLRQLSASIQTTYESILEELSKRKKKTIEEVTFDSIKNKRSREEILGEYLTALVFQIPDPLHAAKAAWGILSAYITKDRAYQKLISYYLEFVSAGGDIKQFSASLPSEFIDIYNTALLYPLPTFVDTEKYTFEIRKTAEQLKSLYLKEQMKTLADSIKLNESSGRQEEVEKLQAEYSKLVGQLKD